REVRAGRLGRHRRPDLPGFWSLRRGHHDLDPPLVCISDNMMRAETLSTKIVTVMIRAPAQASCCQSLYGLNANWKITTGRFAIGAVSLVLQNWSLSAVNNSGAVSPLMRAIASNRPVTMPLRAAG